MNVEYHLGAGSAVGDIRLRFSAPVTARPGGELAVRTEGGEITVPAPEVFLESGALSSRAQASYLVRGDNTVSLNIRREGPDSPNSFQSHANAFGFAAPLSSAGRTPHLLFSG